LVTGFVTLASLLLLLLLQVRGGELLNHVLRHHRHSQHLGLQLHWRPLYDMLRGLYDAAPLQVKGEQQHNCCGSVHSANDGVWLACAMQSCE
jgi:hypothetical protein